MEWNTGILLKKALEGAASQGAETEFIHLYDLNYKGCTSCFACKMKDGKSYGKCAVRDELTPILRKIEESDGIILSSPVYFGTASAETLIVTDTYQFDDYSKYVAELFDADEKAKRRKEVFPTDCQKAFEMGARIAQQSNI